MNLFNDFIKVDLKKNMGLYNLTDEFFCFYLNAIREKNNNVLVVVDTIFEANKVYNNLSLFTDNVYLFPMDDFLTSEALAISPDLMIKRLETINNILNKENVIVIVNLMGYLRYLPLKETYLDSILDLKVGSVIAPSELVSKLVSIGYTRDTLVTKTGEFGVRGYVIDIFPLNEENPIRIEFFDDEIESIRYFNVEDQKSIEKIDNIKINPIFEFLSSKNVLEEHFGKQKYLQCYEKVCNISAYLDNCITVFKDYDQIKTSYIGILNEVMDYKAETDTEFEYNYMFDFNELSVDFPLYYFSLNNYVSNDYVDEVVSFDLKPISNFNEDSEKINTFINKCIKEKKTVLVCLKRFQIRSILKYLNMKIVETDFFSIKIGCVNIIESELNKGFIYNDLVVLTSFELFNDTSSRKKYVTKFKYSSSIKDINKLSVGDYVVHNTHGIGRYNGIKTLTMNDITKDYLEVLYQGNDKIYIPVEKIELISKYSGREGIAPKINKLGGSDWSKTKNRVKTKVNDIADKLLKL